MRARIEPKNQGSCTLDSLSLISRHRVSDNCWPLFEHFPKDITAPCFLSSTQWEQLNLCLIKTSELIHLLIPMLALLKAIFHTKVNMIF